MLGTWLNWSIHFLSWHLEFRDWKHSFWGCFNEATSDRVVYREDMLKEVDDVARTEKHRWERQKEEREKRQQGVAEQYSFQAGVMHSYHCVLDSLLPISNKMPLYLSFGGEWASVLWNHSIPKILYKYCVKQKLHLLIHGPKDFCKTLFFLTFLQYFHLMLRSKSNMYLWFSNEES